MQKNQVTFYGAAGTVTGSQMLFEVNNKKILVDCGMFMGIREEEYNRRPFGYNPEEIDYVILTHPHMDHGGAIPKLVKEGYKGPIISTEPSKAVYKALSIDSGEIQSKRQYIKLLNGDKEKNPNYMYNAKDAMDTFDYFKTHKYDEEINLTKDIKIILRDAGHMLGSAIVEMYTKDGGTQTKTVVVADPGNKYNPIFDGCYQITDADNLIMEMLYQENHRTEIDPRDQFREAMLEAKKNDGKLIVCDYASKIPATLKLISDAIDTVPELKEEAIWVDSPLATAIMDTYTYYADYLNDEMISNYKKYGSLYSIKNLNFNADAEVSDGLSNSKGFRVVISPSGTDDKGRISQHLKNSLSDKSNIVFYAGAILEGTLGMNIYKAAHGLKNDDIVSVGGQECKVRTKVIKGENTSGHMDLQQRLEYISNMEKKPQIVIPYHTTKFGIDNAKKYLKPILPKDTEIVEPEVGKTIQLAYGKTKKHFIDNSVNKYKSLPDFFEQNFKNPECMSRFEDEEVQAIEEIIYQIDFKNKHGYIDVKSINKKDLMKMIKVFKEEIIEKLDKNVESDKLEKVFIGMEELEEEVMKNTNNKEEIVEKNDEERKIFILESMQELLGNTEEFYRLMKFVADNETLVKSIDAERLKLTLVLGTLSENYEKVNALLRIDDIEKLNLILSKVTRENIEGLIDNVEILEEYTYIQIEAMMSMYQLGFESKKLHTYIETLSREKLWILKDIETENAKEYLENNMEKALLYNPVQFKQAIVLSDYINHENVLEMINILSPKKLESIGRYIDKKTALKFEDNISKFKKMSDTQVETWLHMTSNDVDIDKIKAAISSDCDMTKYIKDNLSNIKVMHPNKFEHVVKLISNGLEHDTVNNFVNRLNEQCLGLITNIDVSTCKEYLNKISAFEKEEILSLIGLCDYTNNTLTNCINTGNKTYVINHMQEIRTMGVSEIVSKLELASIGLKDETVDKLYSILGTDDIKALTFVEKLKRHSPKVIVENLDSLELAKKNDGQEETFRVNMVLNMMEVQKIDPENILRLIQSNDKDKIKNLNKFLTDIQLESLLKIDKHLTILTDAGCKTMNSRSTTKQIQEVEKSKRKFIRDNQYYIDTINTEKLELAAKLLEAGVGEKRANKILSKDNEVETTNKLVTEKDEEAFNNIKSYINSDGKDFSTMLNIYTYISESVELQFRDKGVCKDKEELENEQKIINQDIEEQEGQKAVEELTGMFCW